MTFYYNKDQHPTMILDSNTRRKLLVAIRSGVIDMIYFPELYHPDNWKGDIDVETSEEEAARVSNITKRLRQATAGQGIVTLNRELKLRLLNAVRANEINLNSDFPELEKAYQSIKMDFSAVSKEELDFVLEYCRKRG